VGDERGLILGGDSFTAFDEALSLVQMHGVDMVSKGSVPQEQAKQGDVAHTKKPHTMCKVEGKV
jgi:hypothetical protein